MSNYTGKYVVANKRFGYAGKPRDVGEVFQLKGMRNDAAIWGLTVEGEPKLGRYTDPFKGDPDSLPTCAECGAKFKNHGLLDVHGRKRHGGE